MIPNNIRIGHVPSSQQTNGYPFSNSIQSHLLLPHQLNSTGIPPPHNQYSNNITNYPSQPNFSQTFNQAYYSAMDYQRLGPQFNQPIPNEGDFHQYQNFDHQINLPQNQPTPNPFRRSDGLYRQNSQHAPFEEIQNTFRSQANRNEIQTERRSPREQNASSTGRTGGRDWANLNSSTFEEMMDRVIMESKKKANRFSICSSCWVWVTRQKSKYHEGKKKRTPGCCVLSKKKYSLDETNKANKNLSEAIYRERVTEVIIQLAKKTRNFDEEKSLIKILIDDQDIEAEEENKNKKIDLKMEVLKMKNRGSKKVQGLRKNREETDEDENEDESNSSQSSELLPNELEDLRSEFFDLVSSLADRISPLENSNIDLKKQVYFLESQVKDMNQKLIVAAVPAHNQSERNRR